jgi:hypothetical protein
VYEALSSKTDLTRRRTRFSTDDLLVISILQEAQEQYPDHFDLIKKMCDCIASFGAEEEKELGQGEANEAGNPPLEGQQTEPELQLQQSAEADMEDRV